MAKRDELHHLAFSGHRNLEAQSVWENNVSAQSYRSLLSFGSLSGEDGHQVDLRFKGEAIDSHHCLGVA